MLWCTKYRTPRGCLHYTASSIIKPLIIVLHLGQLGSIFSDVSISKQCIYFDFPIKYRAFAFTLSDIQ